MKKGSKVSEEMKQKLREARSRQVHPDLAKRGITREMYDDAIARGLKWCCGPLHKSFLDSSLFGASTQKCIECTSVRNANYRATRSPERRKELIEHTRNWRKENPDYERTRIPDQYGIGSEWYVKTLDLQGGTCVLCGALEPGLGKKYFCIDHNHTTGAVRGILCNSCNYNLGFLEKRGEIHKFKDGVPDLEWGRRALAYLASFA